MPAGETVTVWHASAIAAAGLPNQFQIIATPNTLANHATGADEFTFVAPADDATLLGLSAPAGYYTVTAGEGITLTYGNKSTNETIKSLVVKAGEDVDVKSDTGEYFAASNAAPGEKHVGGGAATADTTDFTVASANDTIYAAVTVTKTADVTATYVGTDGDTVTIPSTSGGIRDVAVGTELTIAATNNGSVVIEGTGPVATEALGTTYTVGENDVTLTAAWTVVLGEGVTASINSTTRTAGTYYVTDNISITGFNAVSAALTWSN